MNRDPKNTPKGFDDEDEDDAPMGNPADLRNEGPLESLGKAISAPITGAAEDKDLPRPTDKPKA